MNEIFEILRGNDVAKTLVVHKESGSLFYFTPIKDIPKELPDDSKIVYDDGGNTWIGVCLEGTDKDGILDWAWTYFKSKNI